MVRGLYVGDFNASAVFRRVQEPAANRRARNVRIATSASASPSLPSVSISPSPADIPRVKLGQTDVEVPVIGIGAWAWGDKFFWNDGDWNGEGTGTAKITAGRESHKPSDGGRSRNEAPALCARRRLQIPFNSQYSTVMHIIASVCLSRLSVAKYLSLHEPLRPTLALRMIIIHLVLAPGRLDTTGIRL